MWIAKSLSQMNVQGTLPLVNAYQSTNAGGFKRSFCAKIGNALPGHPLWIVAGSAFLAHAVREFRLRMVANVTLQLFPVAGLVANLLAPGTDGFHAMTNTS